MLGLGLGSGHCPARLEVPDAPKLHGTVTTTRACDFEARPGAAPTIPIGPLAVRPNLEVAAVRLRRVGENDARAAEASDSQHARVQVHTHQRAVRREEAEALMGVDGHAVHVGGVVHVGGLLLCVLEGDGDKANAELPRRRSRQKTNTEFVHRTRAKTKRRHLSAPG